MPGGVAFLCQGHFSRRTDPSESSGCSSGLNYFGKVKVRWPVDRSATNVLEKGDKDAWSGESLARWKTGLPRPILVERHGVGTKGERRLSSPEVLPQSRRSSSALFARECRKELTARLGLLEQIRVLDHIYIYMCVCACVFIMYHSFVTIMWR